MSALCTRLGLLAALGLVACKAPPQLPPEEEAALVLAAEQPESLGALRYEGEVFPLEEPGPALFRYERRVMDRGEALCASHLTLSPSGVPVVLHQAEQGADLALLAFEEIHAQLGLVGRLEVDAEGSAHFETWIDGRHQQRREAPGAPLVVGPTLFGYVQANWDSLVDGEVHTLRFVVLADRRAYRFELQQLPEDRDTTVFEMRAANPLLALGVPTMTLVFDAERKIVSYSGRVPPMVEDQGALESLDAEVRYTHF